MKKTLSIIIPCKDDYKIIKCIRSINDKKVEIVIVFNGSTVEFINWVKNNNSFKNTQYINIGKANLALALEKGTQVAKNEWVLYMDSDCTFSKNAVKNYILSLNKGYPLKEVYKGDIVFKHNTKISHIIAKSRYHHTAEQLTAYKPPLLLSKKIVTKIGGYFFNEKLIWREDSDLDNRIRQSNINIIHIKDGTIYHGALTLKGDLRSTYRYGIGLAIANILNIKLTEVPRSTISTFKSQGFLSACYMFFRNRIYSLGYYIFLIKYKLGKTHLN